VGAVFNRDFLCLAGTFSLIAGRKQKKLRELIYNHLSAIVAVPIPHCRAYFAVINAYKFSMPDLVE
jgi:hypothetical protein